MIISLLGTTSILIVFVSLVLAIFLFLTRSERVLANRLFGIFLILTAIDMSAWFWYGEDISQSLLYALRTSVGALQMPFFLGFIVAYCYSDFKLTKIDWLHAIPFFLVLYTVLPGNQLPFGVVSDMSKNIYIGEAENIAYFVLTNVQYYVYIAAAVYILLRFRSMFQKHYSDSRALVFRWLWQLVMASIFAHSLVLVRNLIGFNGFSELYSYLQIFGALLVLAILTWITLKALLQPEIFRGVDSSDHKESKQLKKKASESPTLEPKKTTLLTHMLKEQPYLNAELTLIKLAEQVGMTQRELSELINVEFEMHFFDFINNYRIDLAKDKLLADKSKTVLEILYSVGFNSKSSFNTAFKKHTQTTPTAFRQANAF